MGNNKLIFNPDKTEFIFIGDENVRNSMVNAFPVSLLGNAMEPAISVKNLAVTFDADGSLLKHVTNV